MLQFSECIQWCRLCGRENSIEMDVFIKDENFSCLANLIQRLLAIDIRADNKIPAKICDKCKNFMLEIVEFSNKSLKVQEMFNELNTELDKDFDLKCLREKYGLQDNLSSSSLNDELVVTQEEIKPEIVFIDFNNETDTVLKTNSRKDISDEYDNFPIKSIKKNQKSKKKIDDLKLENFCNICNKGFNVQYQCNYNHRKCNTVAKELYECKHCRKICKSKASHRLHENSHLPKEEREIFSCKDCDKKFNSQSGLWSHIHTVHAQVKSCICDICGRTFATVQHLTSHKFTHSEERPYQCSKCGASFKRRDGLWAHIHTHGESHTCPICKIKLSTKLNLRRHMICHNDEKNYKCNFCQKDFKRLKSLNSHLIIHIGVKPYQCKICSEKFVHDMVLRRHLRKFHPTEYSNMEANGEKISSRKFPKLEELKALNNAAKNSQNI